MRSVLLDTNVLSELVRQRPEPRVVAYVKSQPNALVSVLTLHELAYGAARVDDEARRTALEGWLAGIRGRFAASVVAVDAAIAERAGRIRAEADRRGRGCDVLDVLIAATALERDALVATRNVRHFETLDVDAVDPWST